MTDIDGAGSPTTSIWRGVIVATTLRLSADGSVDFDGYAEQVGWLATNGCRGVAPNGSLGEYIALEPWERAELVKTAVQAAPDGFVVVAGVGAPSARESVELTEQAAKLGADAVMALPPTTYRANEAEVIAHFTAVASVGLPVCAYNNPIDTKVDLTPALLGRIAEIPNIESVKDFSGDVRRVHETAEHAPGLEILAGSDDLLLESVVCGAVGWIAGLPNALPSECVALFNACAAGDLATALPLYRALLPSFRWDSRTEFVQAIKHAEALVGRPAGPVRLPRLPLGGSTREAVDRDMRSTLAALGR